MEEERIVLGAVGIISYELYLIHGYVLAAVPISVAGALLLVFATTLLSIVYWLIMKKLQHVLLSMVNAENSVKPTH